MSLWLRRDRPGSSSIDGVPVMVSVPLVTVSIGTPIRLLPDWSGPSTAIRYIGQIASLTESPAQPARPTSEAAAALLVDVMDIDAVWSARKMVVIRGQPKPGAAATWITLEQQAFSRGWQMRREEVRDDWVVFVEPLRRRRFPWLAVTLFVLTVITVTLLRPYTFAQAQGQTFWSAFRAELPFALTLFPILLAHEFGHYIAARYHGYPASLPYFLPGFSLFGTFGAIIVARYPFPDRRVLFDVAIAGPIAGFVVCIPVLWFGLMHSQWVDTQSTIGIALGEPLIMQWISQLVLPPAPGPDMDVVLHPAAFAGWAGLLVTMLNLMPFGQLDGGKTVYALAGMRQKWIAIGAWFVLALSLLITPFWSLWLILALVFRLPHPPTLNDDEPLTRGRKIAGWLVMGIFVVSFMPFPFRNLP